jgi:predicted transcriptional regulator
MRWQVPRRPATGAGDSSSPTGELDRVFGALERRVLDALWAADGPRTVRDLQPSFPGVAYTTLMTTLDRLHRKQVLSRTKAGKAYRYTPLHTREALVSGLAGDALAAILGPRAEELRPILSFFVDAVSREDREALDALEQLVRAHRDDEDREEEP